MPNLIAFCCYAQADKWLYDKLAAHLKILKRKYPLTLVSNHDALIHIDYSKNIKARFGTSDIVVLFISPDFLASHDFEAIEEYYRTDRRQRCIVPILLRPVNWRDTAFSRFQVLPKNEKPITGWKDQDEAFEDVAMDIRAMVESLLAEKPQIENTPATDPSGTSMVQPGKATNLSATPFKMRDYIYISDAKLDKLEQQIGWPQEDIAPIPHRYQALTAALAMLRKGKQIKKVNTGRAFKNGDYIFGTGPIKWGVLNCGTKFSFFFSPKNAHTPYALLMAGSVHHLIDYAYNESKLDGLSSSSLPNIVSAIEFAAENNAMKWSEGIGSFADYLFASGFVQGKFIHQLKVNKLSTPFPEQEVEFVARVLKPLLPPSAAQLASFSANNAVSKQDREEIKRMLQDAPTILLCSPLYVVVSNSR